MVHYKLVKVTINIPELVKVILDMVIWYHGLPDSIMSDRRSFFTLKFWSLLCFFLGIKQRLLTDFYPLTKSQTKQQNSIMELCLQFFFNFEQINLARFLAMKEFAYNNEKNTSTSHMSLELNYGYHFYVSYKKDLNPYSKSKLANKLLNEL